MSHKDTPIELTVVALTFLVYGIWSCLRFFFGGFGTSIGILGIPIYFGLLGYNNIWRICALIFAWATLLVTPMVAFFIAFHRIIEKIIDYDAYHMGVLQTILYTVFYIIGFAVAFMQYKVLTSNDVRPLFTDEYVG